MVEDKKSKLGDIVYWVSLIVLLGLATFFITADFSRDWRVQKAKESESSSTSTKQQEREMRQQMQQMQGEGGGMPAGGPTQ